MRRRLSALVLAILAAATCVQAPAAARGGDRLLREYITAVADTLDPRVRATLTRVDGDARRLLALRSYLRAGSELPVRWSWTAAEIRAYEGSAERRALDAAIAQVRRTFETQQPGYTLFVQSAVRSLDLQIERWNTNASVGQVAASFHDAAMARIQGEPELRHVTGDSTRRFAALLRDLVPEAAPTLSAPGLSRHGQMRAVDFIVRHGDAIVAGADSATLAERWERGGWSERLHAAVIASGAPFEGPLQQPPEPWHYEYRPAK